MKNLEISTRRSTPVVQERSHHERLAYGIAEACALTGIGKTTLYKLIGEGALSSCKIGNRRLIRRVDLEGLVSVGHRP
jgi:excisionase family DNA binding protein